MLLIIEDEPLIAKMLGDVAAELFDNFTVVSNLEDALEYEPEVVIVDGNFPDTNGGKPRENWKKYLKQCKAPMRIISSGDYYLMESAVKSGLATHSAEKSKTVQLAREYYEA